MRLLCPHCIHDCIHDCMYDCIYGCIHDDFMYRPHVEAMSMGLPVIATNWSGPTAFLDDEVRLMGSIVNSLAGERLVWCVW